MDLRLPFNYDLISHHQQTLKSSKIGLAMCNQKFGAKRTFNPLKTYLCKNDLKSVNISKHRIIVIIIIFYEFLPLDNEKQYGLFSDPIFDHRPCSVSLYNLQGVSKKRKTFDLKYLKDGSIRLIVLLVCYSVLPYNSLEHNFSFL